MLWKTFKELAVKGIANSSLRLFNAASRLLFLLVLARYLTPDEVGVFGLISGTMTLAVQLLGLEFYFFSTRELVPASNEVRSVMVRDQWVMHSIFVVIAFPAIGVVFWQGILPPEHLHFFYAILLLEHLAHESTRTLIALEHPVRATLVLLARSGLWVYPWIALIVLQPLSRDLFSLWLAWSCGGVSALFLALRWLFFPLRPWAATTPVNWKWLFGGLQVALPALLASAGMMGAFTVDRYALKLFWSDTEVGVYSLFFSIARIGGVVTEAGVSSILLPRIVAAYKTGDLPRYRSQMGVLAGAIALVVVLVTVFAIVLIHPLLTWLGHEIYRTHLSAFWPLLGTTAFMSFGVVPHFGLYARGHDRPIVVGGVMAFLAALCANLLLTPRWGIQGTAWATCSASAIATAYKGYALLARRNQGPSDG